MDQPVSQVEAALILYDGESLADPCTQEAGEIIGSKGLFEFFKNSVPRRFIQGIERTTQFFADQMIVNSIFELSHASPG